jgi:hypothetical protein
MDFIRTEYSRVYLSANKNIPDTNALQVGSKTWRKFS